MAVSRTSWLAGVAVAERIGQRYPEAVREVADGWVVVEAPRLPEVAAFLRDDPELDFKYLISLTAVDRLDHFEVVYHLQSLRHNHLAVLKALALDHEAPALPSLAPVWQGAYLQEREAYDLMGIRFLGHPDLRRVFLWEGFPGHPLRKDFLSLSGGLQPGLHKFPREATEERP
ncbi:MAG TPA: NADH-quinone oxidoreductase subunit C [Dehalococcoidia bacterium]|nr:NADH-quinone oxidoreductase subunit C [Dehalococcoidia bacterium]